MKNKIFILLFVLIVSGLFSGCTDYLDTKPYSTNTVDKLYTSADGAELGLTGCYNVLNSIFWWDIPFMMNGGTDELIKSPGLSRPGLLQVSNYAYDTQNPTVQEAWTLLFRGVNRANFLIDNVGKIDMDDARKQEILGEGHYLRAFFYFYLAVNFGGVPIYDSPIQEATVPRSSLEDVYKFIIDDLTWAYENMNDRNTKDPERANKWSAAGYLAKVYTYLASCKINNVGADLNFDLNSFSWVDENDMYKKAKDITDEIIEKSGYSLIENYDYLFRETTELFKDQESLFVVQGSKSASNGQYNLLLFFRVPVGGVKNYGGGYGWLRPTGELFYKYDELDLRKHHNLVQNYPNNAPSESIEGVKYFIPNVLNQPTDNGYCVGKYRMRDPALKTIPNKVWSDGNIPLLRFADIILLRAEARYYLGDEPGARADLTLIRKRIARNGFINPLETAYHKDDFMEELLDERSRELCCEGWRRIDLIRFGKLASTINSLSPDRGRWNDAVPELQANFKPHKIWFPIPQNDIDFYPIQQNPGYAGE